MPSDGLYFHSLIFLWGLSAGCMSCCFTTHSRQIRLHRTLDTTILWLQWRMEIWALDMISISKILLFLISSGLQFLHFILLDSFSFIIQFFFLLFRLHAQSSTDVMLQVQVKTHQWLIPTFLIQQPWKKILVKNYIGFEAPS